MISLTPGYFPLQRSPFPLMMKKPLLRAVAMLALLGLLLVLRYVFDSDLERNRAKRAQLCGIWRDDLPHGGEPLSPERCVERYLEEASAAAATESESAWRLLQNVRKYRLRNACAHAPQQAASEHNNGSQSVIINTHHTLDYLVANRKRLMTNFLVDDVHKLIYCQIPTVASSQWIAMMTVLRNVTNFKDNHEEISRNITQYANKIPRLSQTEQYSDEDVKQMLRDYRTFVVSREPMERLLSAYLSKFVYDTPAGRQFKKRFAAPILQAGRGQGTDSDDAISFSEFLQYLVNPAQDPSKFEQNWAPIYHLCHPCSINYDYLSKLDTLHDDAVMILSDIFKKPADNNTFPDVPASGTAAILPDYLQKLQSDLLTDVRKLYSLDAQIFGY